MTAHMVRILPDSPQLERLDMKNSLSTLRTGDIVLFSGYGIVSASIRLFTRSYFSHIGLVIRHSRHEQPMLLESSTLSDVPDVYRGCPVSGIGMVPLVSRVMSYEGPVALRRRAGPCLTRGQQRLAERLTARVLHRPYKNYVAAMARDLLTGYQLRADLSGMFCSELVAEFYRRLGWLPRTARSSLYVPGHFASENLKLEVGQLDRPVWLKAPGERAANSRQPAGNFGSGAATC